MSFILYVLAGILSGLLGGMGMGGGTILIPVLTIFLGVEQHVAQAANLLAFLPMAAISLGIHAKQNLVRKEGVVALVLPALVLSVAGSLAAAYLTGDMLRKLFGAFLIFLAAKELLAWPDKFTEKSDN